MAVGVRAVKGNSRDSKWTRNRAPMAKIQTLSWYSQDSHGD